MVTDLLDTPAITIWEDMVAVDTEDTAVVDTEDTDEVAVDMEDMVDTDVVVVTEDTAATGKSLY